MVGKVFFWVLLFDGKNGVDRAELVVLARTWHPLLDGKNMHKFMATRRNHHLQQQQQQQRQKQKQKQKQHMAGQAGRSTHPKRTPRQKQGFNSRPP